MRWYQTLPLAIATSATLLGGCSPPSEGVVEKEEGTIFNQNRKSNGILDYFPRVGNDKTYTLTIVNPGNGRECKVDVHGIEGQKSVSELEKEIEVGTEIKLGKVYGGSSVDCRGGYVYAHEIEVNKDN